MFLFQLPSSVYMKSEMAKTKEQLAEDKKMALAVRVQPLVIEKLSTAELKQKAHQLWDAIVRLESEKYDLEERRKRQEYDVRPLSADNLSNFSSKVPSETWKSIKN